MVHRDPFITELDLEPFRPFAYSHDAAVHFRDPRGTHWLVLDSIYAGQQAVTVHVVRPADLTPIDGVGGGMDNWAEYLVRAISKRDARAVALFSYWPDNPYDVIRRVIFRRAEGERSILGVPPRSTDKIPRYSRHKDFYHYGFDDVSNMLGTPVPKETPTENAARANRLSDWAMLEAQVRGANYK